MRALQKFVGHFARSRHLMAPKPREPEVVQNARKPMVGLFSSLSDSQKAKALNLDANTNFGPSKHLLGEKSCG
jgi:hypothetical protein